MKDLIAAQGQDPGVPRQQAGHRPLDLFQGSGSPRRVQVAHVTSAELRVGLKRNRRRPDLGRPGRDHLAVNQDLVLVTPHLATPAGKAEHG